MPKSDAWPVDVAMASLSNVDSAGSCESVLSMNSAYSEDSMEHLSAEERACLMYLEETIEALEVQEDSGFSNDEPDLGLQAGKLDISSFLPEVRQVEDQTPIQTPDANDLSPSSMGLGTPPESVTAESVTVAPSTTHTRELCVTTDESGNPMIVPSTSLQPGQSREAPEMDMDVIPPPSDFMDKPHLRTDPVDVKDIPMSAVSSNNKSGATIDLELLRQRASVKRLSGSSPVAPESPTFPEVFTCGSSPPTVTSDLLSCPPPESPDPRTPPAVAPKPKKLPANIIRKSHKSGSDNNMGHSVSTGSGDRMSVMLDPNRVHKEALIKLGLLKMDEADSGPALSPNHSPKTRKSWAAPPSPIRLAAPHTPPLTPSNIHISSTSSASGPLQSLPAESLSVNSTASGLLPAPAAFSDLIGSQSDHGGPAEIDVDKWATTPQLDSLPVTKPLTPPATLCLERSGSAASRDFSMASELRNSRPRPASLGNGKEFSTAHGENAQAGHGSSLVPDSRKPPPAHSGFQHSADSQKLPRSEGISVLICPRSDNEEERRSALKKLGLLRD